MYIFLSHSSKDAEIAQKLCDVIESNNTKCFLAPRDIRSGYEYASEIVSGIDKSNALLLVLSENSNNSPHVLREIERAVTKSIPIIVYKLEDVKLTKSMEYFLMTHQWLNYKKGDYTDVIDCINNLKPNVATPVAASSDSSNDNVSVAPVTAPNAKPKRKKYILPIVIALSALVISGAIIAGTFILKHDKETGTKVSEETTGNIDTTESSENTTTKPSEDVTTTAPSEDDTTSAENTTTEENNNAVAAEVELGDTIIFGRYNDADIIWKVLKINDDGKTAILISDKVLTMKGFDGADGGHAGYYNGESQTWQDSLARTDMEVRAITWGNGSWELSTIRTWLNSEKEYVEYQGCAPTDASFSEFKNGYSNEPGFLYNFTDEEREAIVETTISTKGNILSDKDTVITQDKVFLLSVDELKWFEGTGISVYATPTPQAVENNQDLSYRDIIQGVYKTDTILWWLRDPVDNDSAKCYTVSIETTSNITDDSFLVNVEGWGIRPAITVDLTSALIQPE